MDGDHGVLPSPQEGLTPLTGGRVTPETLTLPSGTPRRTAPVPHVLQARPLVGRSPHIRGVPESRRGEWERERGGPVVVAAPDRVLTHRLRVGGRETAPVDKGRTPTELGSAEGVSQRLLCSCPPTRRPSTPWSHPLILCSRGGGSTGGPHGGGGRHLCLVLVGRSFIGRTVVTGRPG